MARFYFDFWNGEDLHQDEFGMELDSLHAARQQATLALGDLMRDCVIKGEPSDGDSVELSLVVRDASGQETLKASMMLLVTLLI